MRHIVNFGLLFCFGTLAATGALAFCLPFSIATTRVHVIFGLATTLLVGLHLFSRIPYFRGQLFPKKRSQVSKWTLAALVTAWGLLLATAVSGWEPAGWIIRQGYEAQNRAAIVRASSLAGFLAPDDEKLIVSREPGDKAEVAVTLILRFDESAGPPPTIAVWAESTTGSMIETLYIDPRLAYAEEPKWGGTHTPRKNILPIWRHRYTLVSGVAPSGEFDARTAATPAHSFTLDDYLTLNEAKEFVLCVEVNVPADTNEAYDDPAIGQPALLYTAYIEVDSPQPYSLLELTGHGGGAEKSGEIQYDLEGVTTAKKIVDLPLAKIERRDGRNERPVDAKSPGS